VLVPSPQESAPAVHRQVVLVIEPVHLGHRLNYVRLLVEEVLRAGNEPVLASTARARLSVEWEIFIKPLEHQVRFIEIADKVSLAEIARLAMAVSASMTVVPNADQYLTEVALRGWDGHSKLQLLVMRPGTLDPRLGWRAFLRSIVKSAAFSIAQRRRLVKAYRLRSAITPADLLGEYDVGDPIEIGFSSEDSELARARLRDLPDVEYWFGVFGGIDPRKNLDMIATSLLPIRNAGLLVCGRVTPEAMEAARTGLDALRQAGRLILLEGRQPEALLNAAIHSVDCVVVAQATEAPSGIAGKAVALGVPLLLSGASSLKRDSKRLRRSALWVPLRQDAISRGMRELMARPSIQRLRGGPNALAFASKLMDAD
jgi:hypothetical protein